MTAANQPAYDRTQRPVAHLAENIPTPCRPSMRGAIAEALKEQESEINRLDHILTETCGLLGPILRQAESTEAAKSADPLHGVGVLDAINERTAKIRALATCMARINDRIAL